jgi:preprotein translocase subunit YajC
MNSLIPDAMAQTAGAPASGSPMGMFIMMGLFVVIFYFLLIRPQQKKQKEHQAMLGKLAAGDEVVTAGGILGRIVEIGENFITLEIADNVRIKVQRFQVTTLVPKGTLKGA